MVRTPPKQGKNNTVCRAFVIMLGLPSQPSLLQSSGLTIVHETKGLLFVDKPPGLSFHASGALGDPGILPLLRAGAYSTAERLPSVHRLDRVTSGLLMVAKSAEAAREVGVLLREQRIHKYYVALTARKPSKKMGRVSGDMERSRRGSWKLLRSMDNPAVTDFVSRTAGDDDAPTRRALLLKPRTGRTHQLRVALKALSSPVLGDPLYAAAHAAAEEERAYLHATALRLPAGMPALTDDASPIEVICAPTAGAAFNTAAFRDAWTFWFGDVRGRGVWFEGTPVASQLD